MSAETQTPPAPGSRLRVAVIVLAVFETLGSLSNLTVFGNLSEYRDGGIAQRILIAGIAVFSVLSIVALYFAIKGDVRRAIMAIAGVVIVTWLTDHLPSMFTHGLEFLNGDVTGLYLFLQMVVFPLLAVLAFVLARRNERLALAAFFASLSTLANIVGVIAFAIGVAIYGF